MKRALHALLVGLMPAMMSCMPMVAGNEADESGVWEITGPVAALPLYRKMRILADPRGEFDPSIAEDRLASDSIRNSARRSEPPFLGLSSGAHWARITIKNNGQGTNFVLVNEFRRVQELELFSPDGRIYRTGMDIPIADRSLPIDELALPLEVGIGETKSILLRIRGESIPVYLPLVMFDEESFDRQLRWRDRITGLYFGALVVMFIYNLFLYVSLRDRTYLFYVLYLVSVIFLSLSQRDLLPESLFPAGSFRDRAGLPMGIMLAGAFSVLFAYHYLRIERHEKLLRIIFIVTGIGFGGISFFSLFRILTGNEPAIGLLLLLFGLPLLVLIAAGRRALRGYRPAYVFLVAYFCLIFASLISVLSIRGLFPYHILGLYAGFIGTLVEMLLLSLGLAYRFREIEMESESARSAYRAKSEFLANMSHEIRTPLNAIVGATDMLMEASLGKQERKYIEIIQNTSGTLASLIDDILDIARIEAGRLEIKSVPFQVQELVENTLDLFSVQAAEKDIELSAYVDQSIPARVVGDSLRLRQILTNLMGNAIKFTERGEISVRVEHALQDGNMMAEHYRAFLSDRNINLLFQIRDTGIGIPIEKWEIIFSSFAQADSTITRQYGGSGLGLAICRQLSELMGGYIWVDSLPENGSSFYVMLPFQPDGQWEVGAPPESKNRSVLVVDKNETSQYILRRYLEAGGVKVETVSTIGAAARLLDTSSAHRFDLIFLDSRMSNEDSFAFVESQVRERPEMAARFVLMTRRTSDLEKRRGQELRIHSFLVKPIKRDDVWQLLRDSSVDPDGQPGQAIVFNQKKKTEPRPLHILLVEDNEDNRTLFQAFVRSANNAMAETNPRYVETDLYRVDEATNGEQAVELSARTNYDVIFMDIQMPVMDGLTATRQIRRRELDEIRKGGRRSHTPIFALTAYALKEEMEKSMAAGCTGHINKPLKKKALLELLESFTES